MVDDDGNGDSDVISKIYIAIATMSSKVKVHTAATIPLKLTY